MGRNRIIERFMVWRSANVSDRQWVNFLSVIIGVVVGFAAIIIKNSVHLIQELLTSEFAFDIHNYLYFAYPALGIFIVFLFMRYIIRRQIGHGIPTILYSISKDNGFIARHNMFSSIIASAITVGFGGSVGLEGPTVATGSAWGSALSKWARLNRKQTLLLLACAGAGAMSAIFKAPIAATVFVLEVLMIDLTMASIVPLLFASVAAALTSFFFLGQDVLYPFEFVDPFNIEQTPYYIGIGIFAGLTSVYFARMYKYLQKQFDLMKNPIHRWLIGGVTLGVLIFLFPSLYGEGYEAINGALRGDFEHLFNNSVFYDLRSETWAIFALFILVIFFKVIATSATFGAGGIGGIFAPTLFMGANTGLLYAKVINYSGIDNLPESNFALVGMGGLIAGVLHAPLTAIFLIAQTTGGYKLIMPLMIVAATSYAIVRIFEKYSVYTHQLARRGELFTHNKNQVVLSMMSVRNLIEKDFRTINPDAKLRELIDEVAESKRNIIPVIEEDGTLHGIIFINDIRHLLFRKELYDKIYVRELMFMPAPIVDPDESMEEVAQKFQQSSHYNLPVMRNGKYLGFVSRANVFSSYQKMLKDVSEE
ncbi:MAG: chloride channel protein [Salinivirgaceae bacterium]|nr:MAG: chloride channel protein [Salinivirgaceae bacterium]